MNPVLNAPPTQDYFPQRSLSPEGRGQGEASDLPAIAADDPRVLAALEEYLAAVEAGRPLDRQEFLQRHSAIGPALRKALGGLDFIKEIGCHLSEPGNTLDAPALAPELAGGEPLGDFRILRQIGRGGMGVVYEAEQISLGRRVALKVLPFAAALDAKQLQRFKNEAQAAAQLVHQHIVPVYGVGCERGVHYYAMQLIEGHSLAAMIAQLRRGQESGDKGQESGVGDSGLPTADANTPPLGAGTTERPATRPAYFRTIAGLGVQAAEGLEHAHQMGVIHRDVKPGNLLIDPRGNLWITDFGLAHFPSDNRLTLTGDILGTLRYMSPEAALAKRVVVDHRTDIYSLGATLYELLTLEPVFRGDDRQELLRHIAFEDPKPPRRLNKAIPAELETIVLKAMEKNPAERYGTAQEVADDLERYLKDEPIRAKRPSVLHRLRKWSRRHQPIVWSTAVSAALLLLVTATVLAVSNVRISNVAEEKTNALITAKANEEDAKRKKAIARRNLYAAHMNLAQRNWEEGRVGVMVGLLKQHLPQLGEEDLRDWEWHYQLRLCHNDLHTLVGNRRGFDCVAFSPNGRHLAAADDVEPMVRIWDADSGKELYTLKSPQYIHSLAFSPDGRRLAAGGHKAIQVWDMPSGRELHTLKGHTHYVCSLAFSADSKVLTSAGEGMVKQPWEVKAWDADGQQILNLHVPTAHKIGCAALSADQGWLATGGTNGIVNVWHTSTGKLVRTFFAHKNTVHSVAFSPDGLRVATGGMDKTVTVWDATNGAHLQTMSGHIDQVKAVVFSPDGKQLASAGLDQTVRIWDAASGKELNVRKGRGNPVAFHPDGKRLVSGSWDRSLKVWEADSHSGPRIFQGHTHHVKGVAFSPDGQRLVSAGYDNSVRIWNAATGKALRVSKGHTHNIYGVAFSPDGRHVASVSSDCTLRIWDAIDGQEPRVLSGDKNPLVGVAFSPDGRRIASSSFNTVKVWDVATGQEVQALEGHTRQIWSVAFSSDGRLASAGDDRTIRIWRLAGRDAFDGKEPTILNGHTEYVTALAFSPDGRLLASAGADEIVKIWDTTTGQELRTLIGHSRQVLGVAFSKNGKRLATAGADETVRVWDPAIGQELYTLKGHNNAVNGVAFSPDGRRLASAGWDRTIRVWDAFNPNRGEDAASK